MRKRFVDIANKIILGDITFDEGVKLMNNNHAEYCLRKLIKGDFYLARYDNLDYDYILRKWAIRKQFYEQGYYRRMHPYYKKMFPDVVPKKLGKGGRVTFIGKDGSEKSFSMINLRNPIKRIVWSEVLESDFTLDKIRYADAYTKVQYWDILRHNPKITQSQSTFSQVMDALVTGLTVTTAGIGLSGSLVRAGFNIPKSSASAISKVRVAMLKYRLNKMNSKVIPRNEFEMKTFKTYTVSFSKKAAPIRKDIPPLERRLIRTQHKTIDVRITRKRKIVNRACFKGSDSDKVPTVKKIRKIRRLNKGKVNIGPAKGMSTPRKLNAFNELKIRTPSKNYSMIEKGPLLNIPPRAPFRSRVVDHRGYIAELKAKYGLKRKHLGRGLSVSGTPRVAAKIRQSASSTSSSAHNSLANTSRQGPGTIKTTDRGMGRGVMPSSITPSQPIGGIVSPGTRRRRKK